MTRMEQRLQVVRGCLILLAVFVCAFLWLAILSFDPSDWPSPHVWPNPVPANNNGGMVGAWLAYRMFLYFGKGAYAAVGGMTLCLGVLMRQGYLPSLWQRVLGVSLLTIVVSSCAHMWTDGANPALWPELRGGILGYVVATWLVTSVKWMTLPILMYALIVGLLFTAEGVMMRIPQAFRRHKEQIYEIAGGVLPTPERISALAEPLRRAVVELTQRSPELATNAGGVTEERRSSRRRSGSEIEDEEAEAESASRARKARPEPAETHDAEDESEPASASSSSAVEDEDDEEGEEERPTGRATTVEPEVSEDDLNAEPVTPEPKMIVNFAAPPKLVPTTAAIVPQKPYPAELADWEFPPLSLLGDPEYNFNAQQEEIVREKARLLERTLQEYRIEANVVEIDTGPVITMFELNVAPGVKVSSIVSLSNDIARALKAPNVRVVAPIPGKNTVGIEVPNLDKEKVRIKELMTAANVNWQKMALPLFLGKDASGHCLVADLATMPHLLIAGTTGSGKSVCINSIILSVLMTQRPDMCKLIMVDPKMVEMSIFKDVPHLMCPIVTEMDRAEKILEWATVKMDERYALLAEAGVRNIAAYNRLTMEEKLERFQPSTDEERAQIPMHLPYVVIIIDELADMMMIAAKEVEQHIARLAQKSRAIGFHLIVATQRPEAKIVTGLIKSNLPSRIAFRVASRMDSRIVLDQNGAEVLMGQGDMLYLPPGSSKLIRAQGTYLEDSEIKQVIEFLKERGAPEFHPELVQLGKAEISADGPRDELFDQAVDIVLQTRRGSVSLLQRRLTIGYSRASRLIEEMAAAGIVGAYKGSQAREVLITPEEWQAMKENEAAKIRAAALSGGGVPDDMFDDDID